MSKCCDWVSFMGTSWSVLCIGRWFLLQLHEFFLFALFDVDEMNEFCASSSADQCNVVIEPRVLAGFEDPNHLVTAWLARCSPSSHVGSGDTLSWSTTLSTTSSSADTSAKDTTSRTSGIEFSCCSSVEDNGGTRSDTSSWHEAHSFATNDTETDLLHNPSIKEQCRTLLKWLSELLWLSDFPTSATSSLVDEWILSNEAWRQKVSNINQLRRRVVFVKIGYLCRPWYSQRCGKAQLYQRQYRWAQLNSMSNRFHTPERPKRPKQTAEQKEVLMNWCSPTTNVEEEKGGWYPLALRICFPISVAQLNARLYACR